MRAFFYLAFFGFNFLDSALLWRIVLGEVSNFATRFNGEARLTVILGVVTRAYGFISIAKSASACAQGKGIPALRQSDSTYFLGAESQRAVGLLGWSSYTTLSIRVAERLCLALSPACDQLFNDRWISKC